MLYKMMEPSTTQVGDRVIVFAGIIRGVEGTITHIAPKGYGIITRYRVQLDNGQETACSITEIYLPTPEADPAAERDQLRETCAELLRINAVLLFACEWAAKSNHHPACKTIKDRCDTGTNCTCHVDAARAAIEKARKEG